MTDLIVCQHLLSRLLRGDSVAAWELRRALGEDDSDGQVRMSLALSFADNVGIWISNFGPQRTAPETPRSHTCFDSSKDLVIDLSETGVSPLAALSMDKLCIMAIVEPSDERGWKRIKAVSVRETVRIDAPHNSTREDGDAE